MGALRRTTELLPTPRTPKAAVAARILPPRIRPTLKTATKLPINHPTARVLLLLTMEEDINMVARLRRISSSTATAVALHNTVTAAARRLPPTTAEVLLHLMAAAGITRHTQNTSNNNMAVMAAAANSSNTLHRSRHMPSMTNGMHTRAAVATEALRSNSTDNNSNISKVKAKPMDTRTKGVRRHQRTVAVVRNPEPRTEDS